MTTTRTDQHPRVGDQFTHRRQLDLDWKPGPGQKHADAPKARMQVTRVAQGTVWFRNVSTTQPGVSCMSVEQWLADYGTGALTGPVPGSHLPGTGGTGTNR